MNDPDGQRRLQKLISSLRVYHAELEEARRKGLDFVAERALEEICKREAMIRRHCEVTGLAVPPELSEDPEATLANKPGRG